MHIHLGAIANFHLARAKLASCQCTLFCFDFLVTSFVPVITVYPTDSQDAEKVLLPSHLHSSADDQHWREVVVDRQHIMCIQGSYATHAPNILHMLQVLKDYENN